MLHGHLYNPSAKVDCVHCQVIALTPVNYEVVQEANHNAQKTKFFTSPNPLQFAYYCLSIVLLKAGLHSTQSFHRN